MAQYQIVAYARLYAHRTIQVEADSPQAAARAVHAQLSADIGDGWTVMDEHHLEAADTFDIHVEGSPDYRPPVEA